MRKQKVSQLLHASNYTCFWSIYNKTKLNGIYHIAFPLFLFKCAFEFAQRKAKMSTQSLWPEQLHHLASSFRSVKHLGQLNLNFEFTAQRFAFDELCKTHTHTHELYLHYCYAFDRGIILLLLFV